MNTLPPPRMTSGAGGTTVGASFRDGRLLARDVMLTAWAGTDSHVCHNGFSLVNHGWRHT
ncbi:hypothetical protein [Vreelandella sp. H-I2]